MLCATVCYSRRYGHRIDRIHTLLYIALPPRLSRSWPSNSSTSERRCFAKWGPPSFVTIPRPRKLHTSAANCTSCYEVGPPSSQLLILNTRSCLPRNALVHTRKRASVPSSAHTKRAPPGTESLHDEATIGSRSTPDPVEFESAIAPQLSTNLFRSQNRPSTTSVEEPPGTGSLHDEVILRSGDL